MEIKTFFASAYRESDTILKKCNEILKSQNYVIKLLDAIPTTVILLNKHRQTVYCNHNFLEMLNIESEEQIIGMRLGEILHCENVLNAPSGCGTSLFCKYCPAVNAMLDSLKGKSSTIDCKINIIKNGEHDYLELRVTATPLTLGKQDYICFSVSNITDFKRLNLLEHIFIHDISNTVTVIQCITDLLKYTQDSYEIADLLDNLFNMTKQLSEEIQSHRELILAENNELKLNIQNLDSTFDFLQEFKYKFRVHQNAINKTIQVSNESVFMEIITEITLLKRIFGNMLKNALEASSEGDIIHIGCFYNGDDKISFYVHNPQVMIEEVKANLFKRAFSTKGVNRGLGTYSIKLLTEKYLKGKVSFKSYPESGTTFTITIPVNLKKHV
ncbi:MAG TPA: PAS domain-containing sensor histidine kinase [Candidatus Cloacimonadota bacterium]|nr:PAS domain-containing sensor histidine kinase [Candidatus Cloacimonadota bacterium]HOD54570.1 PAS domain-containing sensor histidine kinase [Candidatus Cloacimonadota bacterium]HPM00974.1 PAS domain-containing sensor histidine kinase [Candidatus Cloacimonadota bacterium]